MEKQTVECEFRYSDWYNLETVYTCNIYKIISENTELEFIGKHENKMTNQNVEGIDFSFCTISKVPQGLTKIFPYLKFLKIRYSKLKSVERNDLKEYKNLIGINFESNEISYLPGDLFDGWKNLEVIDFDSSKIKAIEPNLLNGLEKLRYVDFRYNKCISKRFDSIGTEGDATLQEIKDKIRKEFSTSPWKVIFDEKNRSKQANDELMNTVEVTKDTNENFVQIIAELRNTVAVCNEKNEKLQQSVDELRNAVEAANDTNIKLEETNAELRNKVQMTDDKNEKLEQTVAELRNAVEAADDKNEKLKQAVAKLRNRIEVTNDINEKFVQIIAELRNTAAAADEKNKNLERQLKRFTKRALLYYHREQKSDRKIKEIRESIVSHSFGICRDIKKAIENVNSEDFTIQVDGEDFPVHKFLLAARSPVLKEMIEKNIDDECLKLVDISKETFDEILDFIYTDELPQSNNVNFLHLYAAAGRFKIENLKIFAAKKLIESVNSENAMEILTLANKYESKILRQKAVQILKYENKIDEEI